MTMPAPSAVLAALRTLPRFAEIADDALVPLERKGLAHGHLRINGGRALARIPLAAFGGLDPARSLEREAECFARAQASDATPRLLGVLPVSAELPFGALVVDDIPGSAPHLPGELPALAAALAAIHKLKLPDAAARAPIDSPADPIGDIVAAIDTNLKLVDKASLDPKVKLALGNEIVWARDFAITNAKRFATLTRALCLVDAHPGNFVAAPGARAYAVDLEKCIYGLPGLDVAHAIIPPSTSWDPDCAATLDSSQVDLFFRTWAGKIGDPIARETASLLRPFRRLVWLRTTSVFIRFRVEGTHKNLDPRPAEHATRTIDAALDPATIAVQRKAWS
ncbi:MAG: phosphotransferase [Proteobacteria bacterium]|nr:phosphotransferase [Pseudomonadota bacterium]